MGSSERRVPMRSLEGMKDAEYQPGKGQAAREAMTSLEIINLGCKVNQSEGRVLARRLASLGFDVADRWEKPRVTVINACAVTAASEAKARKEVARARGRGSSMVVLTGCLAGMGIERWREESRPDAVVPQKGKEDLPERLAESLIPADLRKRRADRALPVGSRAKAFIKAQDGCGHPCSYCVVPALRGGPVSFPAERIIGEARRCLEEGAGELILCGINLGAWGDGKGGRLDRLASLMLRLGGGFRLRLSSIDPQDLDEDLLDGLREIGRLCPHFHIPLQSGSDRVLRAMERGYGSDDYLYLIEEIRRRWNDCAVTTDVIVGFPGESEADFNDTLELLREIRPSRVHVFRYSPRPGTKAAKMSGQVSEAVKRERAAEVSCLATTLSMEYADSQAGKELELLVERSSPFGVYGTTGNYLKALIPGVSAETGALLSGRVERSEEGLLVMNAASSAMKSASV